MITFEPEETAWREQISFQRNAVKHNSHYPTVTTLLLGLVQYSVCSQARQHLCSSAVAPWLLLPRPQSSSSFLFDIKGSVQS